MLLTCDNTLTAEDWPTPRYAWNTAGIRMRLKIIPHFLKETREYWRAIREQIR